MSAKKHVFVYGTLRQGECRNGVLRDCTCIALDAHLTGYKMLNIGAFPGIIPAEDGEPQRITGEVYEIDNAMLLRLDRIEGYNPDNPEAGLYDRHEVQIETERGETLEGVITYVYNNSRFRNHTVIESGDWMAFQRGEVATAKA